MSLSNPGWGAPRIHGELLKVGIDIWETSVGKYMVRRRKPPSQTWRTFLENRLQQLVAVDFFVVPTVTFRILFVFVVPAYDRRRIPHFNVTAHPTAECAAQQIREAFPWQQLPVSCCGIETGSTATRFGIVRPRWTSRRPESARRVLGRILLWSD